MTWAEILEDKFLNSLDWRIESDRWGNIVMSPPPRSRHGEYQSEVAFQLRTLMQGGMALTECPLQTSEGVKAIDVAWVSRKRRASRRNDPVYLIAPEICVEILWPSNSPGEMEERWRLYFDQSALECWLCGLDGQMTFRDPSGPIPQSNLCPKFPAKIDLD